MRNIIVSDITTPIGVSLVKYLSRSDCIFYYKQSLNTEENFRLRFLAPFPKDSLHVLTQESIRALADLSGVRIYITGNDDEVTLKILSTLDLTKNTIFIFNPSEEVSSVTQGLGDTRIGVYVIYVNQYFYFIDDKDSPFSNILTSISCGYPIIARKGINNAVYLPDIWPCIFSEPLDFVTTLTSPRDISEREFLSKLGGLLGKKVEHVFLESAPEVRGKLIEVESTELSSAFKMIIRSFLTRTRYGR